MDQLPGGKYSLLKEEEEVLKATKSKRAGEKDFSDLDREVNRASQCSTIHISGTICFRNNQTWQYCNILPAKRRLVLLMRSMMLGSFEKKEKS